MFTMPNVKAAESQDSSHSLSHQSSEMILTMDADCIKAERLLSELHSMSRTTTTRSALYQDTWSKDSGAGSSPVSMLEESSSTLQRRGRATIRRVKKTELTPPDAVSADRHAMEKHVEEEFSALEREVVRMREVAQQQLRQVWKDSAGSFRTRTHSLDQKVPRSSRRTVEKRMSAQNVFENNSGASPAKVVFDRSVLLQAKDMVKKSASMMFKPHEAASLEMRGSSVLVHCTTKEDKSIMLESLNAEYQSLIYGGADVKANLLHRLSGQREEAKVSDNDNGSYTVSFRLPKSGAYTLEVYLWGSLVHSLTSSPVIQCEGSRRIVRRHSSKIPRPTNVVQRRDRSANVPAKRDSSNRRESSKPRASSIRRVQSNRLEPANRRVSSIPRELNKRHDLSGPRQTTRRQAFEASSGSDDSGLPRCTPDIVISPPQITYTAAENARVAVLRQPSPVGGTDTDSADEHNDESFDRIHKWLGRCSYPTRSAEPDIESCGRTSIDGVSVGDDSACFAGDLVRRLGHLGSIRNPQGVCSSRGLLWVSDSNAGLVHAIDIRSRETRVKIGRSEGLLRPVGVALSPAGNLFVSDYEARCVHEFTREGKPVRSVGGAGKLQGPKGIAVDSTGRIIVADNKANAVVILSASGRVLKRIVGDSSGRLSGPQYVAVTPRDDILVTDFHSNTLKVFDKTGKHRFTIGGRGEGMGQFSGPTGVACDSKGRIGVADRDNSRLQVLESDGSFHSYVDTTGARMFGPQGVCFTSCGLLAAADAGNQCVKLFKYGDDAGVTDIDADITGVVTWQ